MGCGGGESGQPSLPERPDIWVSSITINPDSKIKYIGKTTDLGITSISKVEEIGGLQKISVGDTIRGVRIGAIKCIFHGEDSSYGGKQFMWRGRWGCLAGRSKYEIENAVKEDGAKRYDYIHIAPVTISESGPAPEASSPPRVTAEGKSITKNDVVGVYENKNGRTPVKYIFHENGKVTYKSIYVSNTDVLGWKIVGNEVHIINLIYTKGTVTVFRMYPNGVLKNVGLVSRGRRMEFTQEKQITYKKLKGKLAELARLPVQEKECLKCKNIIKFPGGEPCPPCPKCGLDLEALIKRQQMLSLRALIDRMARQGDSQSQHFLGERYQESDPVKSYAWFSISARNGNDEAVKAKRSVTKKMTPEQISKAEALAKEMIEKNADLIKKEE